jgi:hypothetical protein
MAVPIRAGRIKFAVKADAQILAAGNAEGIPVNFFVQGLFAAEVTLHDFFSLRDWRGVRKGRTQKADFRALAGNAGNGVSLKQYV